MLVFEYPWLFLALPLPLLMWWLLPAYREQQEAVRMPFFRQAAAAAGVTPSTGAVILKRNIFQRLMAPLVWILLVTAMARPQWVEPPVEQIQSARDLMLAVDLSQSMEARDFVDAGGNQRPVGNLVPGVDLEKAPLGLAAWKVRLHGPGGVADGVLPLAGREDVVTV